MRSHFASSWLLQATLVATALVAPVLASYGDRLPEFKKCVEMCEDFNCGTNPTRISFYNRLLLWDCPAECDYTCQHIVTDTRLASDTNYREPIVQFHGKWPFFRWMGMQEPFSVLFSLLNFLAHDHGIQKVKASIPAIYPLRKYYLGFGYFGLATWIFSMLFHTRDFNLTEKLDYFAAGASVLYGTYYAAIRVFRLDKPNPRAQSLLRIWTATCICAYAAHVIYLTAWSWDYTYNMAANVVVGLVANFMWLWLSWDRYKRVRKAWATWPAFIVLAICLAMSCELLDFPPLWGALDAHALWHAGTVLPTLWWYNFLVKDAQFDLHENRDARHKA